MGLQLGSVGLWSSPRSWGALWGCSLGCPRGSEQGTVQGGAQPHIPDTPHAKPSVDPASRRLAAQVGGGKEMWGGGQPPTTTLPEGEPTAALGTGVGGHKVPRGQ